MAGWKFKESPKQKGLKGIGVIKLTKNMIKIAMEDSEEIFEVEYKNAPDNVKAGRWHLSLSADGTRLYGFTPINGAYKMRFKKMAAPDGQLPAPSHVTYTWEGKEIEYDAFTIIMEIVEGKDIGLQVPMFLRYNFEETDGVVAISHKKSKYTTQLLTVLDSTGVFEKGEMQYSENILPALEARMRDKNKLLMVIMKNGYPDSMTQMDEEKPVKGKVKKELNESADSELDE